MVVETSIQIERKKKESRQNYSDEKIDYKATDQTYVKRQATLCSSETGMEPSASKNTSSYICKILWIIVEEILAHKQATSAIEFARLNY